MKKVLLFAVLGATLASMSVWAMEKVEDTPTARAQYLKQWEQGSPEDLSKYVHKDCYGAPNPEFQYTTTFDINDEKPVVISSLLLKALLEREGETPANPDDGKKIVAFSQGDNKFELRLKKSALNPAYIECSRSNVWISGPPHWEQVPGWVVSLVSWADPVRHLIFSIRPIENVDAQ